MRWTIFLVAASLLSGCEQPVSLDLYPQGPDEAFEVVESLPNDGEVDVPTDVTVGIRFTSRPDPDDVSETTVTLTGDQGTVPSELRVDLVQCVAEVRAVDSLDPQSTYTVTVDGSLVSAGGKKLGQTFETAFTTAASPLNEPTPVPVSNQEINDTVFKPHCGCCHSPTTGAFRHILALDPARLRISSREVPDRMVVEPGRHDRSYLMHKILGLSTIEGEPMPPPGLSCGTSEWPQDRACGTSDPLIELLAKWIDTLSP